GLFDQLHESILHWNRPFALGSPAVFSAPASDGGVIAAQENFGHSAAAEVARACVLGIFESSIWAERLIDCALRIAQDARDESHDRVDQDHRRDFASRENEVAYREQLGLEDFDDSLVKPLVAAAEKNQPRFQCKLADPTLIEPWALR